MQVTIKKQQLISQLPRSVYYTLLQSNDELPDTFTFDAVVASETRSDKYQKQYPELREALTPIEWGMFLILSVNSLGATRTQLRGVLTEKGGVGSNIIDVHIKNLRRKLENMFYIDTIRKGGGEYGRYQIRKWKKSDLLAKLHTRPYAKGKKRRYYPNDLSDLKDIDPVIPRGSIEQN